MSEDEDPCCAMCCPSPEHSVIAETHQTTLYRKGLYGIMIGDISVAAGKVFLFSPMNAAMQGITVWIDYLGYATMHFCQILVILIFSGFDALVLMSDYKALKFKMSASPFLQILYWSMLGFTMCKALFALFCYTSFKRAFRETHGHMNPCLPVNPPAHGGGGGYTRVTLQQNRFSTF